MAAENADSRQSLVAQGWNRDTDDTFVSTLGEVFTRKTGELIEVALLTNNTHKNLSDLIHGGVIMTLLDRVMGVNGKQAIGARAPTTSITVNFLAPASVGDLLVATARLRRVGRGTVFADSELKAGEKLVATANAIFIRPFQP